MNSPSATTSETADVTAARAGDDVAFERLISSHRGGLQAHCYRMLGSSADAEDALQETLLRAWRGLPGFEGRSSLRSWLYRIATNVCLRAIERRPGRMVATNRGSPSDPRGALEAPLVESVWIEPFPDALLELDGETGVPEARYEQRESVEVAFIAALQHLPAKQRAVLILRDVLGFSPAEIAEAIDGTPASVYSALQRAHGAVDERLPKRSQQATLRSIGDQRIREIVRRYVDAWEDDDVSAIASMLTEDATFNMPPRPNWYRGREAIASFIATWPLSRSGRWRLVPVGANGQLAFGIYRHAEGGGGYRAHGIEVLTLDGAGQISDVTAFHFADAMARFSLPDEIAS